MNIQAGPEHFRLIGQERRGALVVGGSTGSLAVIRSLGRRGIPVWFLCHDHPLAKLSRYTARSIDWPGPGQADAAEWLIALADRHELQGWVLFAGGDQEARLVAKHHARLARRFELTTPDWSVTQFADDKHLTYAHAARVGLATPRCYTIESEAELAGLDCSFPVVLKPTVHEGRNAFTLAKAWRADDRASLTALYGRAVALVGTRGVVVQELIPGNGAVQFSYAGLWRDGKPLGSLVARRLRQYPVEFGYTSTFVETVDNETVETAAETFLRSLGYSGLAELEFKFDVRDGAYKLLDVNPRIWTWIGLGAKSGVDFASLAHRLAVGDAVERVRGRSGVAWRHVSRDVISARQSGSADYRGSLRQATTYANFAADDPWPGLLELPLTAARALTTRLPTWLGVRN